MKPATLSILLISLAANVAHAAEGTGPKRPTEKEPAVWAFEGNWIVCVSLPDAREVNKEEPCQRIGALYTGQPRSEIERMLGAWTETVTASDVRHYVYRPANVAEYAYFVISYGSDSRAQTIQMTGTRPVPGYRFSTLDLGSSPADVERQLGEPTSVEPIADIAGDLWRYGPFPFTLEMVDGRLYSVKIYSENGGGETP